MSDARFVRVPRSLIMSDRLGRLRGAEIHALLQALAWSNKDFRVVIDLRASLDNAGHNERTARRALRVLVDTNVLTKDASKGGRGRRNRYKLGAPHIPWGRFPGDADLNRLIEAPGRAVPAVYLALAGHANAEFRARPSRARLARCCGVEERTVSTAVLWLERNGYLVVVRHQGSVSQYTLGSGIPAGQTGVHKTGVDETGVHETRVQRDAKQGSAAVPNTGRARTQNREEKTREKTPLALHGNEDELWTILENHVPPIVRNARTDELVTAWSPIPNAPGLLADRLRAMNGATTGSIINQLISEARSTRRTAERRACENRRNAANAADFADDEHNAAIRRRRWKSLQAQVPTEELETVRDGIIGSDPRCRELQGLVDAGVQFPKAIRETIIETLLAQGRLVQENGH